MACVDTQEEHMHIKTLYESVTNGIIADLEAGIVPWTKPWKSGDGGFGALPINAATGRGYNGINIPILWGARHEKGYPTHGWMTFKQAQGLGATVRGGEKSTHVVFTKQLTLQDSETEEEKRIGMLKAYSVFNVAQIDGLPQKETEPFVLTEDRRMQDVEEFMRTTGADIKIGGDRACYVPSMDFVALPPLDAFKAPSNYYATALHELGHWTGHSSRLNRDLRSRFAKQSYAAEELIAELTAAFLCAHLHIEGELRHADYIGHWLKLLREDDRAIFTAASKASQAADYLRAFSEKVEAEAA